MEKSAVAPASQELPSSGTGVSAEADKPRGFTGRPHGAKAEPPGLHMRLDDALQRALEHPKYRMTALRFEEAFIEFIESGEQRMVIDESLTGFGKCIAHRVAKLYGLETLTVTNSDNTPSVGVRRTRKSVHIPQVKLRDLYAIRHPWAPEEERPQAQPSAGTAGAAGTAGPQQPSNVVLQPAAISSTALPIVGDLPDVPSGAAPAIPAPQPYPCLTAPMELRPRAAQESALKSILSDGTAPQHPPAASTSGDPADTGGILPGPLADTKAAAGRVDPLTSLQPSKVGLEPVLNASERNTESVRPERDTQHKGQLSLKHRVGSSEDQMSHERGLQPAQQCLPSASESLSQSGGSSVLQGFIAGPPSQSRSSEAQESSQPPSHVVTPITSGESLTASRSDRSEGSQMHGEASLGFRETRRRRGSAGRPDKAGGSYLARGIPAGQDIARDMPILEGQGRVIIPGGTHASSGTRSPVSSMAGQRAGSRRGRQGALDRGSELSNLHPREALGAYPRGREQLHMSEWRGDQSQGRQGRPELAQAPADVPPSPFSKDPRAAPSQSILEQQMSQRLSLDAGHHAKPQLAMSEPLYRPHGQQTSTASLPAYPPATSGTVAAPHQPGFLGPLLPNPSGQLPIGQLTGTHQPYGAFGTPLAIPPGYMLVPAPGAVQGMPMYQPPLQPYPIPGHPGYYYLPPGAAPPLPEGHMGYHSAQHGLTWDPHGTPYSHTPRPSMQAAGMHLPSHARLPPGMAHQYMAAPQMWPAQAAVRLPAQQQPNLAETPQQTQHYQQRQAEQQWPTHSQRQNRQQPAVSAPLTLRSGNLSCHNSGEQTSRRGQSSRQQPRQQL